MNLEIKKDLASNWFKTLQDAFCDDICKLEKNKFNLNQQHGKEMLKKMKVVVNIEFLQNGKIFEKVGVNFSKVYGNFQNNFKKIYLELKKIQDFGHQEFQLLCI